MLLADAEVSEHQSIAEACKKVPHGVICLLAALRFHGFTTQAPFKVWMAIDVKARKPKGDGLPLHIVRFSGDALHSGIEEQLVRGMTVKVYNAAKTIADCFKYRNKISLDWPWKRCGNAGESGAAPWTTSGIMQRFAASPM